MSDQSQKSKEGARRCYFLPMETLDNFLTLYPPCPILLRFWSVFLKMLNNEDALIFLLDFSTFKSNFKRKFPSFYRRLEVDKIELGHEKRKEEAEEVYGALTERYKKDLHVGGDVSQSDVEDRKDFLRIVAGTRFWSEEKRGGSVILITDPLLDDRIKNGLFYQNVISREKIGNPIAFIEFLKMIDEVNGKWRAINTTGKN